MEASNRTEPGSPTLVAPILLPPVQPLALTDLREEIWQEVADWRAQLAFAAAVRAMALVPDAAAALLSGAPSATSYRPLPLRALLALDGAAFITASYQTLLGRPPDQTGFGQLTAELARGCSKIEVLRGIAASAEARDRGQRLRGLQARYALQLLCRPYLALARRGRRVLRRQTPTAAPSLAAPFLAAQSTPVTPWTARVQQQLAEQQAVLELITAQLGAMQAAQEELARKTLAMLTEQHRLLTDRSKWAAGSARQAAAREEELVAATASLSDELAALARRLAALEFYGTAASLRSEPVRLS